ncbi:DUF202 domain-containing protein [Pseudonocardia xinjiangensis]|uniref:DUF202 domain-containing protein n=1 Tax=Pseudonocardia xinjiangensis TaxID=75289 RepID=UPI003D94C6DE
MTGPAGGPPPGLQAERTELAWSRTTLGVLANGLLLSVRVFTDAGPGAAAAPIALAVVIAVATVVVGRVRANALRRSPLPVHLAPTRAVPIIGWSVVALATLTGAALLL